MSVYLSVAPPDGFTRWGQAEWDRWLREHPWEAAERICSRGDWAIFLYQVRALSEKGRKGLEPHLEALVMERAIETQACEELRAALATARAELGQRPAAEVFRINNNFASREDLEAMIAAARSRTGREPNVADLWVDVIDAVDKVLQDAAGKKRGVYFGNPA